MPLAFQCRISALQDRLEQLIGALTESCGTSCAFARDPVDYLPPGAGRAFSLRD